VHEPTTPSGLSRRTFLGAAGAAGLAAAAFPVAGQALGLLRPSAAHAAATLPVRIVNQTGNYANDNVWIHVVGTDLASGSLGHVSPDGTFTPASTSENGADGIAHWGVRLSDAGTVTMPAGGMSGRIYVSLGQEIPFKVVGTDGGPGVVQPVGWVEGDPTFGVFHDYFEFTWKNGSMYCNSTQVDMFSIPIAIRLQGAQDQTVGVVREGGRSAFFDRMRNTPGFADLVVDDVRVIAPGHGIDVGRFSATYLDGYVRDSWNAYTGRDLVVNANNATYTLRTTGDVMTARQGGAQVAQFTIPSTKDVFYCNGNIAAPNDGVVGPIAAVLGAALNRSTLRDVATQPTTDPSTFYQQAQTNHFAAGLHDIHTDGRAYGFPFDDVAGFASYIEDGAATSCTLTIGPLS
jgi:hypothetical protein